MLFFYTKISMWMREAINIAELSSEMDKDGIMKGEYDKEFMEQCFSANK